MGLVYLWTGEGAGKTTSALGVAMRAVGWGKKVYVIHFMKGRETGELRSAKKLGKNYTVRLFGRKGFVNKKRPLAVDYQLAKAGLEYARQAAKKKPFLIILDEINVAVAWKLLPLKEVLRFLDRTPKSTIIYLTGRYAPKKLMKRADFVNVITCKKMKKIPARKGIEY